MSAINPIGGGSQSGGSTSGISGLSQNDFLQLLVSQMQNQDPLNPTTSDQFLQEMASFTEVTDLSQLQQLTQSLISNEVASQGLQLLGRTVTGTDPTTGQSVSGTVSGLTMQNGQPILTVGTSQLPVSSVVSVQ